MPNQTITLRPGVDVQQTPTLNSSGWSYSQLIRFFNGLPQKLGGWQRLSDTTLVGYGRGAHAWADLLGNPYLAVGTSERLQLYQGGVIYDITPIRLTSNAPPDFSTVISTTEVTIVDVANGVTADDWVNINVPVSVGGLIIQGFYQVTSVIDADTYTIDAASAATSTVNNGGAVPSFTSVMGSPTVTVTFANHGYATGDSFTVQVATTVSSITMAAYTIYEVTVLTANTFTIVPGGAAAASTTVSENGGDAQFLYLIPTGYSEATVLTGYGIGVYGAGPYGIGTSGQQITAPLRQWFLDNWGEDLVGNYNGGTLYYWVPPQTDGNVAIAITGTEVPQTVGSSFVAMPEQILVALGSDPVGGGDFDPNLVRWSDVADFTQWQASSSNQAGSFRIPTGSRIVGGIQGPQFGLIWTDIDLWLMQYIGTPLVFSFTKVAAGSEMLSARSVGIFQSIAVWVSTNNFMMYDGNSVRPIPCTVWDFFFNNLDTTQIDKVFCAVNTLFSEASWYFQSTASTTGEVDSYVKYNMRENIWDYGYLDRTCWVDHSPVGNPIGTDVSMLLQQHEMGNDADGVAMTSYIQSGNFNIATGAYFTFVERLIGDAIVSGGTEEINYYFIVQDFPTDTPTTYGPFAWTPAGPPYNIVRARGRVAAVKIESTDLGVFWRLGALRYVGQSAGRR